MVDEYIRKADAVEALDGKIIVTGQKNADTVLQYIKDISNKIKSLKPADVVQMRHGKWTHKPDVHGVVYCSECDYELHINATSFCPNCGAKMDGERKE